MPITPDKTHRDKLEPEEPTIPTPVDTDGGEDSNEDVANDG